MTTNTSQEPSFVQQHWQKLVALAFWVFIVGGGFLYTYLNNLSGTQLLIQIVELMKTPIGPLIYILLYAIRPLTFLSAVALTLVAGSIFGSGGPLNLALAVFYTVIASHVSATVAYFIGRYFGKGLIQESNGEDDTGFIARWSKRMQDNTFEAVLLMRVFFLPFDLVSYLAGFLRVNWFTFISASILGSMAGSIAIIAFGASLSLEEIIAGQTPDPDWRVFAFGLVIMVISVAASQFLKGRDQNLS
ncbi:VTT domain-containing protein [Anaerolineales bacterium HSG6]|nr:VTT domain-containing protein [Anaerolineales bacterium HSG6]